MSDSNTIARPVTSIGSLIMCRNAGENVVLAVPPVQPIYANFEETKEQVTERIAVLVGGARGVVDAAKRIAEAHSDDILSGDQIAKLPVEVPAVLTDAQVDRLVDATFEIDLTTEDIARAQHDGDAHAEYLDNLRHALDAENIVTLRKRASRCGMKGAYKGPSKSDLIDFIIENNG